MGKTRHKTDGLKPHKATLLKWRRQLKLLLKQKDLIGSKEAIALGLWPPSLHQRAKNNLKYIEDLLKKWGDSNQKGTEP